MRRFAGIPALAIIVAGCATQPVPIPPYLALPFEKADLTTVGGINYQDADGLPVKPNEFAAQYAKARSFAMTKVVRNGLPYVTLRLRPRGPDKVFSTLAPGETLPEFHLERLDGTPIDNTALAGRYTLVSFYMATCEPCVKQIPLLNTLAARRMDVRLLAMTPNGARESRDFVARHGLAWPVVSDAYGLVEKIGAKSYPAMALFDPQGRLVDAVVGAGRWQDAAALSAWLDNGIASAAATRR
jgi:peroxiredoxin